MSNRKLLIREVFEKIKSKSEKDTKNGWATDLSDDIERMLGFIISVKTLSRYHDSFITGIKEETGIENLILNRLSEYLGYKDFADFSRTFVKKNDDDNKTTVKISVDQYEESLTEKLSNIIINITNEQNLRMPEFMKQNGFGMVEVAFVILLLTGNYAFSNTKGKEQKKENSPVFGFFGNTEPVKEVRCMYWDKVEYKPADCGDDRPNLDLKPADDYLVKYFKKITRKDTLTVENAVGNTWYSKYNGVVEFFTLDGEDPNNGRELRSSTAYIIGKYAGIQEE